MELQVYLAFVIASTIMILSPGPSVILTVAHSVTFGWQNALATVAGETMGIAVQLLIASIGLTALLNTIAGAFEWLRWIGAAYLVYIGIKQFISAGKTINFDVSVQKTNLFVQGLVITIPNPKSLIFIAVFLPQFINPENSLGLQFAFIVPTFLMITFTVTSCWAFVTGNIRGFLNNQKAFKVVLRVAGILMIIAGIGLALSQHGR